MTLDKVPRKKRTTPERMEKQMMALAVSASEERLRQGTASSAEIVYWLQQGSPEAQLKREKLKLENQLLQAKHDEIIASRKSNTDYEKMMKAFAGYLPTNDDNIIDGDFHELR